MVNSLCVALNSFGGIYKMYIFYTMCTVHCVFTQCAQSLTDWRLLPKILPVCEFYKLNGLSWMYWLVFSNILQVFWVKNNP